MFDKEMRRNELYIGSLGAKPKILSAGLDGADLAVIIETSGVSSIAVHHHTRTLFWSNPVKGSIESQNLESFQVRQVIRSGLGHVDSLVIKENTLFWTKTNTPYLFSMNLDHSSRRINRALIGKSKKRRKLVVNKKLMRKNA